MNRLSLSDPSLWAVVVGNIVSMVMAVFQGWQLGELMWVYWGQSVIIGVMNAIRMFRLKEFSTEGMTMNDRPVPETSSGKVSVVAFFTVHYGLFHIVYAMFLWHQLPLESVPMNVSLLMLFGVGAFACSHGFSLLHNSGQDFRHKKPNLGTMMFYPYLRILPMHLTIIFGGMFAGLGLSIFMVLKLFSDAGMHIVEHKLFQKQE